MELSAVPTRSSQSRLVGLVLRRAMRIIVMKTAKLLPEPVKQSLRQARKFFKYIPYIGMRRFCPVCRKPSKKFGEAGIAPRKEARCMYCGALERHRLTWLYFKKMTDLFDGRPKHMLHVAPEPFFENRLKRQLGNGYLTSDLYKPRAMVKMDITDIRYPNKTFDVVYCSHVLEHVLDDKLAIREFYRVLKSGGWAILLVPITADRTFEDPSVTDPLERLKLFGQEDHVRRYGPDYVERLIEAGFDVKITHPTDFLQKQEIMQMGIVEEGKIYHCMKR